MRKTNTIYPNRSRIRSKPVNLSQVMSNWKQAVLLFEVLYDAVEKTICFQKQWMQGIQPTGMDELRSVNELEQIRLEMRLELGCLLNELNEPGKSKATTADMLRLQEHTFRLQKQNQRVQRVLTSGAVN